MSNFEELLADIRSEKEFWESQVEYVDSLDESAVTEYDEGQRKIAADIVDNLDNILDKYDG